VLATERRAGHAHQSRLVAVTNDRQSITLKDDASPLQNLFGHPLGITFDHEVLVVLLQVISLAGALWHHDQTTEAMQLWWKLTQVKEICLESHVNPVMLGAVERALQKR